MNKGYMTTYSGIRLSHENPRADQITIHDIAHHLSLLCHWCGASQKFFSVAQHSVLVVELCPPELRKWALLHDAAEAYCGDMIRPLKVLLPGYKEVEQRVMQCVATRFDLPWPEPPELKEFDNRALAMECRDFLKNDGEIHDGFGNLIVFDDLPTKRLIAWPSRLAELKFLDKFYALFPFIR